MLGIVEIAAFQAWVRLRELAVSDINSNVETLLEAATREGLR